MSRAGQPGNDVRRASPEQRVRPSASASQSVGWRSTADCASASHQRATLKVLLVNAYQTGGGAGRVGELLADTLRAHGDSVFSYVRDNLSQDAHCRRIRHWREHRLTQWLARRGLTDLGSWTSFFWPVLPEFTSADLLHLHNLHGDYVSIAALPLWGCCKPIVWTLHDLWALTGSCATAYACTRWRRSCGHCPLRDHYPMNGVDRSRFYRRWKPTLIRATQPTLVTPSGWLSERVSELPQLASLPRRVIPNPVDCDRFRPRPAPERTALRARFGLRRDAMTIILPGHTWLDEIKGDRCAVEALRTAAESTPGLQALVVGTGGNERVLQPSGLPGRALPFLADRGALADAYACADVCLFPSLAENYPLTSLEALACGTPVVAFAVGGVPEQIEHLRSGFLAPTGDPGALAAGLRHFTANAKRTHRAGQVGREFVVANCSAQIVAARYRSVYTQAIRRWQRRGGGREPRRERGRAARAIARLLGWETAERAESSAPVAPHLIQEPLLGSVR